jgi:hypothetical protein
MAAFTQPTGLWTMTGGNQFNAFSWFAEFLSTVAQENLYPHLFLHQWGVQTPLPANRGKKIYIPYFVEPPATLVAALPTIAADADTGEAETNTGFRMQMNKYSGEVAGYGGHFQFTDFFMSIEEIPDVLEAGVRQLSHRLAETYEGIIRTKLNAALNGSTCHQVFAGGKAIGTIAATDYLTVDDLFRGEELLKSSNSFTFPDGSFKTILNPRVTYDLWTDQSGATPGVKMTDWLSTSQGQTKYENGMIGKVARQEIYESTENAPMFTGGAGEYTNINAAGALALASGWTISPGAYAVIDLQGMTPNVIIQPFGSAGTVDPLKRNMTVGIKGFFTSVAMDTANRLVGYVSGAS